MSIKTSYDNRIKVRANPGPAKARRNRHSGSRRRLSGVHDSRHYHGNAPRQTWNQLAAAEFEKFVHSIDQRGGDHDDAIVLAR